MPSVFRFIVCEGTERIAASPNMGFVASASTEQTTFPLAGGGKVIFPAEGLVINSDTSVDVYFVPTPKNAGYPALDQNHHLMEYARASMHAENARLNLSIPC